MTAPITSSYVVEHRYRGIVVRGELVTGGWRMTVYRDGRLSRWDPELHPATMPAIAGSVLDVMVTKIAATPDDLAERAKFMADDTPPPGMPVTLDPSADDDDRPAGPCPQCGAIDGLSWQNRDDDRASCGACCAEFYDGDLVPATTARTAATDQEGPTDGTQH